MYGNPAAKVAGFLFVFLAESSLTDRKIVVYCIVEYYML